MNRPRIAQRVGETVRTAGTALLVVAGSVAVANVLRLVNGGKATAPDRRAAWQNLEFDHISEEAAPITQSKD